MAEETDITKGLKRISSRAKSLDAEMDVLKKQLGRKDKAHEKQSKAFEGELKRLKAEVRAENLSNGDATKDYVLVNYNFYRPETFPDDLDKHAKHLNSILGKISSSGSFWHHNTESTRWVDNTDVYGVLFLAQKPYAITPSEIRLQSKSSCILTLETVFLNKEARWPFIKKISEGKELVVAPENANCDYKIPKLTERQCDNNQLEKTIGNNPLALVVFRNALGLAVVPDLQEMANQYVHEVAIKAFKEIKNDYEHVKSNDQQIMEIEAKYNSPQGETGMFATRPVILDPEPDPFLAAIMSSDSRYDRDISLQRLAMSLNDLDRTGLVNYDIPLEEETGVGQKAVSNLAEFGKYVRNILEISCKPQEKAVR